MDADNFIKTKNNPSEAIINILDFTIAKQVKSIAVLSIRRDLYIQTDEVIDE